MSNKYGPRIVTDGLVCCLDAADRNSYPGTGTTWYDLSGNGKNPTSSTAPTFSYDNGGCFNFDASDDYFRFSPLIDLGTVFTITVFLKLNGTNTNASIYTPHGNGSDNSFKIINNVIRLGISQYTDGPYSYVDSSSLNTDNATWYHASASLNSSDLKLYINGTLENSTTASFTSSSWSSTSSYGATYNSADIGRRGGCCGFDSQQYFNGSIACLSFYNKVLSASEVLQNYNATKGRFGL